MNCEDPSDSDWISYEEPEQRYVKVEFVAPMPPNTPKGEVPVLNKSSMSDYYRFVQAVLSMLPMEGSDANFDLGLNKWIVNRLISHECTLFWMQIMHYLSLIHI